ncbi:MAG TPA: beta-galactosidase [Chloroflexota bacterium]|nr:beta-galactosidase [Chloroflexota bacterium]
MPRAASKTVGSEPWYRRVTRWGQTNIREIDAAPGHYDVQWWVEHWKRTEVQGVIVNAGGIVAYYPSRFPLQRRSPYLGTRDVYGEVSEAAKKNGIAVVARMDSSRANERFYFEHPDWFTVDAEGKPYRAGDFDGPFYTACISSPYYREYLPAVLQEICERYQPEGFSDNSWSGLSRSAICYCPHCASSFAAHSAGKRLPRAKNWDDPAYRAWVEWSYAQRISLWELNNAVTHRYGGPDCEWSGMNSGSLVNQCRSFRDWRAMTSRVRIIFLDHQGRSQTGAIWQNGEQGKLIRSLMGDDAPMPESMAMYNNTQNYRLSSKPEPEVRLWFASAVAGGIHPWWHHVGTDHEDRRMFRTAVPLFSWHKKNERSLRDRRHLADVAVLFWQRNTDFYGRDDADERCDAPARGLGQALVRARVPYAMVSADRLAQTDLTRYRALLLPNIGALTDEQCAQLRAYVAAGGGLLATGETSLYDEWGDRREDFGLADVFGARAVGQSLGAPTEAAARARGGIRADPSYMRFTDAPSKRPAPLRLGPSPAYTAGWDETAHLPFGGELTLTRPAGADEKVALTYVPPFATHPPEFSYMKVERTSLPCLYLREGKRGAGRVAYLPADVDRLYWRTNQPDHGDLLASLVRWTAGDTAPTVRVEGPGLVDVHAYVQGGNQPDTGSGRLDTGKRVIVHLVNLTHANGWKAPIDELIEIGEQRITVGLPEGRRAGAARLLVASRRAEVVTRGGAAVVAVPTVRDHEVVVLELSS